MIFTDVELPYKKGSGTVKNISSRALRKAQIFESQKEVNKRKKKHGLSYFFPLGHVNRVLDIIQPHML